MADLIDVDARPELPPSTARESLPAAAAQPFRDPALVAALVQAIRRDVEAYGRPVILMEVCGTHTVAISRSGIRDLLDGLVDLRSGPGCPVCVTAQADIDRMIALAALPGVTILTYGDMVRVPGTLGTLEAARAAGADVRVVYSALDAVALAAAGPFPEASRPAASGPGAAAGREFVFLGVGFETTAPGVCLAVDEARRLGLRNFVVFSAHKTIPAALRALLATAAPPSAASAGPRPPRVQGFILPGHVSAVIGRRAYDFLAADFGLPAAVTGFEPVDILVAVRELVRSVVRGAAPKVVNLYPRVVREDGNARAREAIDRVFEPCPAEWRGLGVIPESGLAFRPEWAGYDAASRFGQAAEEVLAKSPSTRAGGGDGPGGDGPLRGEDPRRGEGSGPRAGGGLIRKQAACRCGDVLRGEVLPTGCPLFARVCTPADPVGPCMVSSEGSCAAYYRYERRR